MSDSDDAILLVIAIVAVLIVSVVTTLVFFPHSIGYKQGQIDALTGKIKYELVIQGDSSRVWEEKGGERWNGKKLVGDGLLIT